MRNWGLRRDRVGSSRVVLKPSESEIKSLIWAIDNALPLEPWGADAFGPRGPPDPTQLNAKSTLLVISIT